MRLVSVLAGTLVALSEASASAQDAGARSPAVASAPRVDTGMPLAELDRLLAPLADGPTDTRRAAAKAIAELGPDATLAITQKLGELRKTVSPGVPAVMRMAKGGKDFDLVDWLLANRSDPPAARICLTYAALFRALVHVGTTPAVKQLVVASSDAGGAFRPEITREMKALGDQSLAALVEAKHDPSLETQRWASNVLESLGKRLPSDAVQTKNYQVLCDVLHAYGAVRDLDAVQAILAFVNHERPDVRAAARDAIEAYGQDALWKLRETYSQVTGIPANEAWTAAELSRDLFIAYDKLRLQEVYLLLDDGNKKAQTGQLDLAVAAFDRVLARQPLLDRRAETAPVYLRYAESIEQTDRPTALAYLRKALRVDENGPHAHEIQSEITLLEAEDTASHGLADPALLKRAIALDPQNARARAELAEIEREAERKQTSLERWVIAGTAGVTLIAGIILFSGRRRRPPQARTRPRTSS